MITALNAVTATTTSTKIWVGDYDRVAILYRAASITSGNAAFTVKGGFAQLASDSPTMTAYNMLVDNLTNTNAQMPTRINSKSLSSNIDAMVWLDVNAPVTHVEIKAWAFLAGEKGKEHLVSNMNGETEIYLKKPEPRPHPFDYQHKGWKWKPTRITIN